MQGGEFQYEEATTFYVPYTPAPSAMPSVSRAPSLSQQPSLSPSLSLPPTETCYWLQVEVLADLYLYPGETTWSVLRLSIDGAEEAGGIIYDNSPIAEIRSNDTFFNADHIANSATNTNVTGSLCNCELGLVECECSGICLMSRGNNTFHDKVNHCESAGGLAAIIYNKMVVQLRLVGHFLQRQPAFQLCSSHQKMGNILSIML